MTDAKPTATDVDQGRSGPGEPVHQIGDALSALANGLRLLEVYMHERPAAGAEPDVDHIEFIRRGLERHVSDAEAGLEAMRQAMQGKPPESP